MLQKGPERAPLTYAILGADDDPVFSIDSTTGVVSVARAVLDHEAKPSHALTVTATEQGTTEQTTLEEPAAADAEQWSTVRRARTASLSAWKKSSWTTFCRVSVGFRW